MPDIRILIEAQEMKNFLFVVILFFVSVFAVQADSPSDVYGNLNELFSTLDPNTGLTAFPTLWIPMGGKYESMATAYTAVADDAGYLEANPSASSVLEFTELSLTHNDWIADSNMEGVVYTMRFNDLGIGIGGKFLYVPFTEYNTWGERVSKGYYSETVASLNASYNFLSNYYFHGIAVGGNLKVAYRHIPEAIHPEQSALMAMLDIGALTKFNLLKLYSSRDKNFSVGAVVKNLGPFTKEEPLPTVVTTGIAYSPIRPLTLAVDLTIPFSFMPKEYPPEQLSVAAGIDIVITNFFALQTGFLYKGSNPRISLGSTINLKKIVFNVTYTLDFTTQLGTVDRFSIGATLNLGDRGRADLRKQVDELYVIGLEDYANGNIRQAIEHWEKALELDSDFTPAREMLKTAGRALALQREMESLQEVE